MMDGVYIYHTHNLFRLCLFCVGTHEFLSTLQSHELTKRALESNDDLGSDRGKGVPSFDEMVAIVLEEIDIDDPTTNVRGRRALAIAKPTSEGD